jgi:hypothetical protein
VQRLLLLTLFAGAGCHVVAGLDGYDIAAGSGAGGAAATTASTTTTSGEGGCSAPDGWTPASVTACDAPTLVLGMEASPASCTPCACGPWEGGTCAPPELWCSDAGDSPGCEGTSAAVTVTLDASGACVDGTPYNNLRCRLSDAGALAVPGSCTPDGGAIVDPPWSSTLAVCDGCGGCLMRQGVHDCPEGLARVVGYAGARDGRACSPCVCDVTGASCPSPTALAFDDETCAGASDAVGLSCVTVGYVGSVMLAPFEPAGGRCSASGGEPSGAVEPTDPWTVCCPP